MGVQLRVVILQQMNFCIIFIPCLWKGWTKDPIKVSSSWILLHGYFLTMLIMVTEQLYWRKILCGCFRFIWLRLLIAIMKRCVERMRSLSIFILFQLQSWIILRMRTKFLLRNIHTKRVIMEIVMMKILNKCIAGRLNNNCFPLNENSSLY